MRQFDVFVFDENFDETQGQIPRPPFTDPELGWFFTNDWNKLLNKIEGEWVVFAHPSIKIDRDFLNNVAEVTDGFPMVDAFAPRIRTLQSAKATDAITDKRKFLGGYLLRRWTKGSGFVEIDENAPMRYVAAPHPYLGIYSRRIIQRTGGFDTSLPANVRLTDFTLRMMHAGGKMFSVPYLVAQATTDEAERIIGISAAKTQAPTAQDLKTTALVLSKAFGIEASLPFALRHPSVIAALFANRRATKEKRKAATLLSKLTAKYLAEVTE